MAETGVEACDDECGATTEQAQARDSAGTAALTTSTLPTLAGEVGVALCGGHEV